MELDMWRKIHEISWKLYENLLSCPLEKGGMKIMYMNKLVSNEKCACVRACVCSANECKPRRVRWTKAIAATAIFKCHASQTFKLIVFLLIFHLIYIATLYYTIRTHTISISYPLCVYEWLQLNQSLRFSMRQFYFEIQMAKCDVNHLRLKAFNLNVLVRFVFVSFLFACR